MRCRRWWTLAVVCAASLVGWSSRAAAHQPLFVDGTNPTPELGPLIVDGTVSFAVYGTLDAPATTRGFRFALDEGDPLVVELLIPAQEPEQSLAAEDLPSVELIAPDGTATSLTSTIGATFDEPFSGTSYIRLASLSGDAQAGVYGLLVTGNAPARFTAVTGNRETRGDVEAATATGNVSDWWATPPPPAPADVAPPVADTTRVTEVEPGVVESTPVPVAVDEPESSVAADVSDTAASQSAVLTSSDETLVPESVVEDSGRTTTSVIGVGVNWLLIAVVMAALGMIIALTLRLRADRRGQPPRSSG